MKKFINFIEVYLKVCTLTPCDVFVPTSVDLIFHHTQSPPRPMDAPRLPSAKSLLVEANSAHRCSSDSSIVLAPRASVNLVALRALSWLLLSPLRVPKSAPLAPQLIRSPATTAAVHNAAERKLMHKASAEMSSCGVPCCWCVSIRGAVLLICIRAI